MQDQALQYLAKEGDRDKGLLVLFVCNDVRAATAGSQSGNHFPSGENATERTASPWCKVHSHVQVLTSQTLMVVS
jgi:hypothetical protein